MKSTTAAAFAVGLLSLPGPAAACGSCAFEITDYALPHILGWCLGITVWFLMLKVIGATEKEPALSSSPCIALAFVVLAFFLGFAFVGPLPFYLLGLMSLVATGKGFSPKVWPTLARSSQIGLKIVSALAVVCALTGVAISMHTKMNRSDADFILRWGGGPTLHKFASQPKEHEATLREVLSKTKDKFVAQQILEALATIQQKQPAADGK